jgi:4-azaleucine resistance transporter AzlC
VFYKAFTYSVPVLLGYLAIGVAFGLLLVEAGYPWYLAFVMSVVMFAGAAQFVSVGLFASGAGLLECVMIQLVLNARHAAYGITMLNKFNQAGKYKYYLIFALSDETFALLSSLDEKQFAAPEEKTRFMFYVALLDQSYWVIGSVIGAVAGMFIPFNFEGIGFALTALFIVLFIEQIYRIKRAAPFVISALAGVLAVVFLPARVSLLAGLVAALIVVQFFTGEKTAC